MVSLGLRSSHQALARAVFGGVLALGLVGVTVGAQADAVSEKREAAMKQAGGALKALGGAAQAGTVGTAEVAKAEELAAFAAMLPELFPEGSLSDESRALPEIWTDAEGWQAKVADFTAAADAVVAAAKAGDAAALGEAVGATGPTCGGCHKVFRGPPKS
ncbi:cytochrome c [Zavarzinia compransoris]|uniref:c-type cytochrome n=1 Tax=Zavarzinia marina TaxID=2911065 RepID=UPI001F3DD539|nr:cytochrome c [Zavarzinia marina]MCF4166643.1 cytochrome c [Zavarzinia marina]